MCACVCAYLREITTSTFLRITCLPPVSSIQNVFLFKKRSKDRILTRTTASHEIDVMSDAFLLALNACNESLRLRERRRGRHRGARGGGVISAVDMTRGERVPVTSLESGIFDLRFYFLIYCIYLSKYFFVRIKCINKLMAVIHH